MSERPEAPARPLVEQAAIKLIMNEPIFGVGEANVLGVPMRAYVNAPDLRHLIKLCEEHGDTTAVVFEDQRWSFAELAANATAIANALIADHGVKKGDKIVLAMRNCPEWLAAFLGVIATGAVVVPLNGWWTGEEMAFGLKDSGAKIAIAGERQSQRLEPYIEPMGLTVIAGRGEAAGSTTTLDALMASGAGKPLPDVEIEPDDDFAIFYTSGSTGTPKGAVLTHRGAMSTVISYALVAAALTEARGGVDPAGENPAALTALPLFHCTASHAVFMMSCVVGRKLVLMRRWDPEVAVDLIEKEEVTNFVGVPTMSHEIMLAAEARGSTLPTLKDIGSGGAKRPPAHVKRLEKAFPGAWSSSGYGLTETNALGTYISTEDYQRKPGAAGRPLPAVMDLKIAREDGSEADEGETGEIWLRGPALFREYHNQPEATAAVLTPDRWFKTGDLGYRDEEGIVFIVDRLKDIIIRGGENISCLEVEHALAKHPGVREAAVIGVPDERLGETVGAAVVFEKGHDESDEALKAFLEPHLAKFKIPETIWRIDGQLPRGGTGKIDKPGLRQTLIKQVEGA